MLSLLKKKTFLALFGGMFLFEAALALWTGHPYDMKVWFQTGVWINQGINIYQPANHLGYPPLWSLWCFVSYRAYLLFNNSTAIWRLIIKLPIIFASFACAYLIGMFAADRFGKKTGVKILLIAVTWSFFIYTGAIWGQIDTISALLTFLAFYALVTKRTVPSAILLGLAVALKLYPIVTLPAFFVYVLRNWNKKEAGKYLLFALGVPVLITLVIFGAFQWSLVYLVRTVFYATPVFQSNPTQITNGCMNFFSFLALNKVYLVGVSPIVWVPAMAICGIYWLRKTKLNESDLVLAIISFYLVFMMSYGWITEQTFLDPTPFILIFILGFNPKKVYVYFLVVIQAFVYVFTVANQTLYVFTPLLQKFSPPTYTALQNFYLNNGPIIWTIRGDMGLVVSLSLGCFLLLLLKPTIIDNAHEWLNRKR